MAISKGGPSDRAVYISPDIHKRCKMAAVNSNISLKQWVASALNDACMRAKVAFPPREEV